MRKPLALLLLLAAASFAGDVDDALAREVRSYLAATDDPKPTDLDTVVVTATRSPAAAFDTPSAVDTVSEETLARRSYRTTPQALRDIPGVMVQETSAGQGSPYIRGFTAFHNLLLVDGIRVNNSVFRPGPNQYWNTIDPFSIERIEIVKGPSSVLYGSDAIGGTVQAITRSPHTYAEAFTYGGRTVYRGSTAENSHLGRGELSLGFSERTAVLLGLTGKTYGDLVAGGDVGTQPGVGYDEWDGDVKVEHFLDDDTRVVLAYQHVQQNNVPRTHRTVAAKSFHGTTVGNELRRELDQERYLVYAQLHEENIGSWVDAFRASVSWQSQEELRDRIRPPARRDKQGFSVGTLGLWFQLESPTSVGRLTYGVEYYRDNVNSFSTGSTIQGPVADDATYDLLGAYVQDVIDATERLEITAGVRLNYAAVDADKVQDPVGGGQISLSDDWTSVVGSLRFLYRLDPETWNLFGGVSQGFRAPNLSDLTRFDSARSNEFEIPAPGLDPEHYVTFELGAKRRGDRWSGQVAGFYTLVRDQIVRFPTGNTNMAGEFEVSKDNVGDGWIYGLEAGGSCRVAPQWTVFGNVTYLMGKVDTFPTSAAVIEREYIDRLMPLTAQVGLRWESPTERFWAEAQVMMAGKADKLSTRDAGDTQRIPPGGTPGYGVLHLRGGWNVCENAELTVAVENVFDKAYRIHGSGTTMPGANLVLSFSLDF